MAFFEKDWFMRQLKVFVEMAASMVLGKPFEPYRVSDTADPTAADRLHLQVVALLDEGEIGGAEDAIFDAADGEDLSVLHVGLDFYNRLIELPEQELEDGGFSREEIGDGLRDLAAEYGCQGLLDELKLSWSED